MQKTISDIQVLRGWAVLAVCIQHMPNDLFTWSNRYTKFISEWLSLWSGVDLFFAISGFVIARGLVPKIRYAENFQSAFSETVAFWIRRVWRLIPSAWFWLLIILIASVVFNQSGAWGSFRSNVEGSLAAVFQVANLRLSEVYGRYESGATSIYWTLSLEEQFYLLFPFLVLLSGKRLSVILAIAVLLQLALTRTPLLTVMRWDALSLGVLIALWQMQPSYQTANPVFLQNDWARRPLVGLLLIGLGMIGASSFHIPIEFNLVAYISAVLVFIASFDRQYILRSGLLQKLMMWVGSRSYAI